MGVVVTCGRGGGGGVYGVWCVGIVVVVLLVLIPPTTPCSCLLRHPQQHVCDSDFVVFARVRRLVTTPNGNTAYKVKVKRLVKGSEKVELMLQKGLLYTPRGTCEATLHNRTSYVITGNVVASKPTITLCNFASPMRQLTPKMKKGFRLLYQSGCDCPIMSCHYWERCPKVSFFCPWQTVREEEDCQGRQSVCLRGPDGSCDWLQGRLYRRCMKTLRQQPGRTHTHTHTHHNTTARRIPPLPQRTIISNKTPTTTNNNNNNNKTPSTTNTNKKSPSTSITTTNNNNKTPSSTTNNNNNSTPPSIHNPNHNSINPYRHNSPQDNRINKGVPGYPRRRKPIRSWYKQRMAGRGRIRQPLRRRHRRLRRPGFNSFLPKTG